MAKIEKARYWVGVLYPENMIDDWEIEISDILGYPYAYCIHDKDVDAENEERKVHVHLMIAYGNTTTKSSVETLFNKLSKEGKICCPGVQSVSCVRNMYEYLIHNTDTSKKKGKHLYKKSERIIGNNFDIGNYEQISNADQEEMCNELLNLIREHGFTNFMDFTIFIADNLNKSYLAVSRSNSSWFERLIRGNYQKREQEIKAFYLSKLPQNHDNDFTSQGHGDFTSQGHAPENAHENHCPICSSFRLVKNGRTLAGSTIMKCKECGKKFILK